MECIELLDRMIQHTARISVEQHYRRFRIVLKEQSCNSEAMIYNVPQDAIVIRLDDNFNVNRLFNGSFGECKRSDFIIVAKKSGSLFILHIEMKLTKGTDSEITKQLCGSYCFLLYLQELGKVFGNHPEFLRVAKHRYISVRKTGPVKRKTKIERVTGTHDSPQKAMKISSPNHIEFAMICGGN